MRGTHSRTTITDFFGLGQDHMHRQAYTIDADHPEIFASEDNGATPPEIALAALAACLTAGVATVASHRGVQLRSVTATVEAGMDLQGILGIDGDVRNGFDGIKVVYDIDADAPRADHRGDRRPVAEALGGVRHHRQPDDHPGHASPEDAPCGPRSWSSAPDRRVWR